MTSIQSNNCDTLILNATVFDGSGADGKVQDVAIKEDKIIAIGKLKTFSADQCVDATGLVLAPGFIDVHTHDDLEVFRNPDMLAKISQGITTVVVGNCGISAYPYTTHTAPPDPINLLGQETEFSFSTLAVYIHQLNATPSAVNVVALVGHTTLRAQVMADLNRPATPEEITAMTKLLRLALQQGAKGLSSGLAYKNANRAPTSEVLALSEELAEFDAIYTTHLRTEFDGILDALDEAFFIGKKANSPVVISHLKCAGKNNWGRAREVIRHVEQAQHSQEVACDCYPYHASSSTLDLSQVTKDFEIFITWSDPHPEAAGQTLAEIANHWQLSLYDAALKLQPAGAVYHGMDEKDVQAILSFPSSMIGSDGLPCDPHPHPRLWGSFPRVLGHYSRDLQLFPLAQAIHKMTGLSADTFKLGHRGFIKTDYFADLVLFDPLTIKDVADFSSPFEISQGIHAVWVNGQLSYQIDKNTIQPTRAGRFLAHNSAGDAK
ncbi:amidohydrolase family protein [Aestuariibacter sp. A3R04]|uniref:N-acyl-D-amino-acid deacylase family protein n=1 Tax=Aestuariibacter sp. A3R04 TaxID=2841571 RepID=UPI001C085338|nr:D-aminoacylase [Aestuariibacter sp. A3R04]MBU3021348.1 D-aminoacylase [Aestuariibacter sp. A3R04]